LYLVVDWRAMPKNQHHPTPDQLDERVKLDLDPEEAIRLIMETGEGPGQEPAAAATEK
jgi:hypothetical protein